MNQELKEKWCAALENGKYIQGRRKLRSFSGLAQEVGYCCLGVLCDIMGAKWNEQAGSTASACEFSNRQGTMLSVHGLEQAGISDGMQIKLSQMNDDGNEFSFIANYIRKNL